MAPEAAGAAQAGPRGHILVVDDQEMNRDLLERRLARQGHTTCSAVDGVEALERLAAEPIDLVLLDLMMPRLDGFGVLEAMKAHELWRDIPVIMISAATDIELVVKAVTAGATDFLNKPFNPVLLRARVGACLEKKALRDRERAAFVALRESQAELAAELAEAANYVSSVLPRPMTGAIRSDWTFVSSTRIGGDGFGTVYLEPDRLVIYLFDVSGHGVGAALLATSLMNTLNSGSLGEVDPLAPAAVLKALNEDYPMERHNQMYFTAWYGVYTPSTRELRYSTAGHPAALLFGEGGRQELRTPGMVIGFDVDARFREATCRVPPGGVLHVFSDGAFEVRRTDGSEMDEAALEALLLATLPAPGSTRKIYDQVREAHGEGLDDDFSLLTLCFD
jgi:sigma-B regulation protein RsbU (phosphoserine phosphatase)